MIAPLPENSVQLHDCTNSVDSILQQLTNRRKPASVCQKSKLTTMRMHWVLAMPRALAMSNATNAPRPTQGPHPGVGHGLGLSTNAAAAWSCSGGLENAALLFMPLLPCHTKPTCKNPRWDMHAQWKFLEIRAQLRETHPWQRTFARSARKRGSCNPGPEKTSSGNDEDSGWNALHKVPILRPRVSTK